MYSSSLQLNFRSGTEKDPERKAKTLKPPRRRRLLRPMKIYWNWIKKSSKQMRKEKMAKRNMKTKKKRVKRRKRKNRGNGIYGRN